MFDCYLAHWDANLKADGGGAGQGEDVLGADVWMKPARYIYFAMLNLIFAVIMINIFAGIIIDKFSALREEDEEKCTDIAEVCFICGENKETFDKLNIEGGFDLHLGVDHNLWNFVYFRAHLLDKDPNDYNGNESFLFDCWSKGDNNWVPIGRSITLVKYRPNNDDAAEKIIEIDTASERLKTGSENLANMISNDSEN